MFKSKFVNLSLISVLLLHLIFPIQVIAETFLPQDPGSVYDDLTGDYGILGIASQFHVFAKEKTTINAHTEGNVATGVLSATNNFGTSITTGDLNNEINYAQVIETISSSVETSASDTRVNEFIVGSGNVVTSENDKVVVNGTRLDHLTPDEFYQDQPGSQYIDFEKEFEQLVEASNKLMSSDAAKTYTTADFPDMNNRVIDCTAVEGDGSLIINVDASVLAMNTPLRINNPEEKVIVINVVNTPADFTVHSQIQYNNRTNHQTEDFSDANISWNFGTGSEKLTIDAPFQGTIIAPCSDITVNQSQDGTIIGKNVTLNATTNRWDPNEIFLATDTDDNTSESSTEPSTSESSTEPSTSESSTESSTSESKSSTESSTSESSTEPSTSESSTEPSTSESSTESSTSESSTEPSTSESSTEPSTSESSTEPSTSESSTEPSTSESSTESSTSESSTEPSTSESSTEPSTSESSTEPSTSESSTEPSTSESSTESSTSESSTEPSTSESSTETTTSESSTYPGKNGKQSDTSTTTNTTTSSSSSVSSTNESDKPVISGDGTVESDESGTMQMNDRRENKVALAVESNTNNDDPSTKNEQSQNQELFPKTNGERNNLWIMVGAVLIYVVTLLFYRRKHV
ncbi:MULTISPECIES: hypothetical protein [Enterococcus]|uniref:hypothetical protein n=1 Tax=Enterococcus TaxID=1350 RepID=UPI00036E2640|nr:hypothetical protein [Enterococcus mundtii]